MLFFENQWFFPISSSSESSVIFLPSFDDKFSAPSTHVERFKPRLVYQRRP
jgi:hypothetical protein